MVIARSRFAPSTTGEAHPGTLLAALLAWLDARSRGAEVWLRLEDLDPHRCKPHYGPQMRADLNWLGLQWDAEVTQSHRASAHANALDTLEGAGLLYPCTCSRADVRKTARPAPDGGFAYANTCRGRPLPKGGWRATQGAVRVRLPDGWLEPRTESAESLAQRPATAMGDPIVVRRDGAMAYHLAVVVDDRDAGVTRVVRGRDLQPATATQVALYHLLGAPPPTYRHHFLLLERRGAKLAKLHGAIGATALRDSYDGPTLAGLLAHWAGQIDRPEPCQPRDLLAHFDWERVPSHDVLVHWDGHRLNRVR